MLFNISDRLKDRSGVYIIKNTVTSDIYIGRASQLRNRYTKHLFKLKNNKSSNRLLQEFVNNNGYECLIFDLLEPCTQIELKDKEQKWIDSLSPSLNLYIESGSGKGYKHTKETIEKLSLAKKGIKISLDHLEKLNKSVRGKKQTQEHINRRMESSRSTIIKRNNA